jgi:short-subunit dehydrogenase
VRTQFAATSNSTQAVVFTTFRFLTYSAEEIARFAIDATLQGKREVCVGPLWSAIQSFVWLAGPTYNIISTKLLWANPKAKYRINNIDNK